MFSYLVLPFSVCAFLASPTAEIPQKAQTEFAKVILLNYNRGIYYVVLVVHGDMRFAAPYYYADYWENDVEALSQRNKRCARIQNEPFHEKCEHMEVRARVLREALVENRGSVGLAYDFGAYSILSQQ